MQPAQSIAGLVQCVKEQAGDAARASSSSSSGSSGGGGDDGGGGMKGLSWPVTAEPPTERPTVGHDADRLTVAGLALVTEPAVPRRKAPRPPL